MRYAFLRQSSVSDAYLLDFVIPVRFMFVLVAAISKCSEQGWSCRLIYNVQLARFTVVPLDLRPLCDVETYACALADSFVLVR